MEDFVPYKLAIKLEQKGFKQGYNIFGYRPIFQMKLQLDSLVILELMRRIILERIFLLLLSRKFLDWLRTEKKIYVSVEVEREDWFEYKIVQTIKNTRLTGTKVYETYPEAILAGIKYVIDNLI